MRPEGLAHDGRGPGVRAYLAMLLAAAALAVGFAATAASPAMAESNIRIGDAEGASTRRIDIGLGKSVVVDLPRDAKEVFVANPQIANAVVRTARKVFVTAAGVGQTTLIFMDAAGIQMGGLDVNVQRDISPISLAIQEAIPGSQIIVRQLNEGVLLSGYAASAEEASRAVAIASQFLGKDGSVANSISIRGRDQVMLKVTVAEINREVLKQLGVNINGWAGNYTKFTTDNPFGLDGAISGTIGQIGKTYVDPISGATTFSGVSMQAFERASVLRTLAEPTLSAVSGESAKFLAGGEFPIRAGFACNNGICTDSIVYKQFGVGLTFTPVVLNEGRISLKVATEVSDIDTKNSVTTVAGITIPAFTVRRADTTIELASGGSFCIAGMIQQGTRQVINGFPGLMNLPILGTLFRSRDYQRNDTELMILVTAYLAKAVDRKDISLPTDGFADATDPESWLLGRFNKIYGANSVSAPTGKLVGHYGFTVD